MGSFFLCQKKEIPILKIPNFNFRNTQKRKSKFQLLQLEFGFFNLCQLDWNLEFQY